MLWKKGARGLGHQTVSLFPNQTQLEEGGVGGFAREGSSDRGIRFKAHVGERGGEGIKKKKKTVKMKPGSH